jgi:hypothetical protein
MNAQTISTSLAAGSEATPARAHRLPWYCYAVVFGVVCVPLGAMWDISWHQTIGRDSFWTPAHLLIYLGGALPGCVCGWLVLKDTFGDFRENSPTVHLWGFQGPLGAWVVILGAFAMLVSAPFDDWWHNAYGLDVQIISPPHTLLALGTYAIAIGALLLVASWRNRTTTAGFAGGFLFIFACGTLLSKMMVFNTEYTYPNQQHAALFYKVAALNLPFWLIVAACASRLRWAATGTAALYMAISLFMMWILPLFPAQPKLAPIYNPVTHMVPAPFPLLLIVPAFGIDLTIRFLGGRRGFWRDTGLALLLGVLFFSLLIAAQWPFSEFLLSPASRNAFFGGNSMWGYNSRLGDWCMQFWRVKENPLTWPGAAAAVLFAALVSRLALWFGAWLAAVKR